MKERDRFYFKSKFLNPQVLTTFYIGKSFIIKIWECLIKKRDKNLEKKKKKQNKIGWSKYPKTHFEKKM